MLSTIDAKKFNALVEIGGLLNSDYGDLPALLSRILGAALSACGGDAAALFLIDREGGGLRAEAALPGAEGGERGRLLRPGEGAAGWAAAHNKSVIENERGGRAPARNRNADPGPVMAAPLRVRDRCVGVIEVRGGKGFTGEDLAWLEIFADQGAAAVRSGGVGPGASGPAGTAVPAPAGGGYHTLIARSPVSLELLGTVDRYAKADAPVLLRGESGVGKELFAEQTHLRSTRGDQPFIRVNCAAIPEGLLESELFGHVKGAFTNAVQSRRGRFEMADGGTIFLDEIGDMPLALQAKLLRVLQQKTFEKVGSDATVTVDVRIIAATNRDIEALVEKGGFRSDLYYRLNVLPLYIPPLRERPGDIPELASFFLNNMIQKSGKRIEGFTEEAMEAMIARPWPGNIRELQNAVERACAVSGNRLLGPEDLFPGSAGEGAPPPDGGARNLKNAINAFKARHIGKVMEENGWNQTEAARALDIQRTYLSRLMKELNITRSARNAAPGGDRS